MPADEVFGAYAYTAILKALALLGSETAEVEKGDVTPGAQEPLVTLEQFRADYMANPLDKGKLRKLSGLPKPDKPAKKQGQPHRYRLWVLLAWAAEKGFQTKPPTA